MTDDQTESHDTAIRCRRCGRVLRHPESQDLGIGKVCRRKEAAETYGPGVLTPAGYQRSYLDDLRGNPYLRYLK